MQAEDDNHHGSCVHYVCRTGRVESVMDFEGSGGLLIQSFVYLGYTNQRIFKLVRGLHLC